MSAKYEVQETTFKSRIGLETYKKELDCRQRYLDWMKIVDSKAIYQLVTLNYFSKEVG